MTTNYEQQIDDWVHREVASRLLGDPRGVLLLGSRLYDTRPNRAEQRWGGKFTFGVDALAGEGVDGVYDLTRPWRAPGSPLPKPKDIGHIECLSVLEHCRDPFKLAANLERYALPGTSLHLAVPFVWRVHAYPDDYWRFTPSAIRLLFPSFVWSVLSVVSSSSVVDALDPRAKVKVPSVSTPSEPVCFARSQVVAYGVKRVGV